MAGGIYCCCRKARLSGSAGRTGGGGEQQEGVSGGAGEACGGCGARGRKNEILRPCWLSQASRCQCDEIINFFQFHFSILFVIL